MRESAATDSFNICTVDVVGSTTAELRSNVRTRWEKWRRRRKWTIFFLRYNNINRISTVIENERGKRARESCTHRERGREREKGDDTQIHQPEDCGFLFYSLLMSDGYPRCLAASAVPV